jgi:hypothetical protein
MDKPKEIIMGCATITDLVVELVKMNVFMALIAEHKIWKRRIK